MSNRRARTVRDQYEVFPYPARDPADEARRLQQTLGGNIDGINHFVFGGRRDFTKPFRVLVAGGGTGDALIYLAQQLADRRCPAEIVYLDLSEASRRIAESRAAARGLSVTFLTGSLLDVGSMGLGSFDYIDCSGVLHHLPVPEDGIAALAGVLAADGGMGLMLYGTAGRSGIYPVQEMLRTLAPADRPAAERVALARRLLAALPPTHLLKRNPLLAVLPTDDAEIFDLYLHSQDRSYSVPELATLTHGAGLRIAAFVPAASYDPASYCADKEILAPLATATLVERAAFAERLVSVLPMHVFYAVREANRVAPPVAGDTAIPVWHDGFAFPAHDLGGTYRFGKNRGPVTAQITVTPEVAAIARTIDGATPLATIRERTGLRKSAFDDAWRALWSLNGVHYLFLRQL
ncbi:MAG: class I SAM-dependent methyltransferase [Solirubrobacterales bacterium]